MPLLSIALMIGVANAADEKGVSRRETGFHVQFGNADAQFDGYALADGVTALVEGSGGSILVAGYAGRMRTDTGGVPGKPMVAHFDQAGKMIWQQTIEKRGHSVAAIRTADGHSLDVMLVREGYRERGEQREFGAVILWSVSDDGKTSQARTIATLETLGVLAKKTETGLVVWEWERKYGAPPITSSVRVHEYDWQGHPVGKESRFSIAAGDPIYADEAGLLSLRVAREEGGITRELTSVRRDGSVVGSAEIPDCEYCRILDVRREVESFEILIIDDDERSSRRGVFLVRFDAERDRVHAVAEYPELFNANLRFSEENGEGVFLVGSDWLAPIVARLSPDRRLSWVSRFMSGGAKSHASVAARLSDGRLAVAGRTGRHLYQDQEADTDAFLIVDTPKRALLGAFGACVVPDGSLARALRDIDRKFRARIPVWQLGPSSPHPVSHGSDSLPTRLAPPSECPSTLEPDLLRFAANVLEQWSEEIDIGSGAAQLTIRPNGPGINEERPHYYATQGNSQDMMPDLVTSLDFGAAAGREIVENVLPVIDEIAKTTAGVKEETGFYFEVGSSTSFNVFRWRTTITTMSPRESAAFIRSVRSSFMALSESERARIRYYAEPYMFVEAVPGISAITRKRRRIRMPAEEGGSIWRWVLSEISAHQPNIEQLERD